MKLPIKVVYDDGREFEFMVGPREFMRLEQFDKEANAQAYASGMKLTWIYYLGYCAARQMHRRDEHPGVLQGSFESFMDVVADVEVHQDDDTGPFEETT